MPWKDCRAWVVNDQNLKENDSAKNNFINIDTKFSTRRHRAPTKENTMHKLLTDNPGEKMLLLGNEAIARGILEGGASYATGYPGNPSSEILETLFTWGESHSAAVEW